jgi:ketosteroid isomerase-like protein
MPASITRRRVAQRGRSTDPQRWRDRVVPISVIALALSLYALGCAGQQGAPHEQVTIPNERRVPGVDLSAFTLITSNREADRREAEAILEVKVSWPRAMQTKDASMFDRILARDFTFREADGRLFERAAYIRDRIQRSETVASARYENVVLQLFGNMAVMTYRNVVSGTDADGKRETWHMSWADVFVREDGRWKIAASHMVSERVEKAAEQ